MKIIIWAIGVLALTVIGIAVYARIKPIPQHRFDSFPGPHEPGKHLLEGGVKYVLPLSDLPQSALKKLTEIAKATPRTRERNMLKGRAFVTRSKLFGFPDVTVVWQQDNHLHIHAHLVMGKSDLGVNAARVDGWLKQLLNQS